MAKPKAGPVADICRRTNPGRINPSAMAFECRHDRNSISVVEQPECHAVQS